jgi:hypothetical protein
MPPATGKTVKLRLRREEKTSKPPWRVMEMHPFWC